MNGVSNNTEQAKLHQFGDRELWMIKGDDWCIPLFLDWFIDPARNAEYAMISAACALYPSQHIAINAVLSVHSLIKGDQQRWLIPKAAATGLLTKAPGITPRYYYRWPNEQMAPIMPTEEVVSAPGPNDQMPNVNTEAFLSFVSKRRGIAVSMLRVVMTAVCGEATTWLLKGKVIELGFVKLAALPYRTNWKQIVTHQCKPWGLSGLFREPLWWDKLMELGMPGMLCSERLIALSRGYRKERRWVTYTIEAVQSSEFDVAANRHSLVRTTGPSAHVAAFEKTVEALYGFTLDALRRYLQKVSLPYARISECSSDGSLRFMPTSGLSHKVRGARLSKLPVNIVEPDSRFSVLADPGRPGEVDQPHAQVQPVPALPPPATHMRQRRAPGAMDAPGDRADGVARMPLLDADQGEGTWQSMLPGATLTSGDAPRMDG